MTGEELVRALTEEPVGNHLDESRVVFQDAGSGAVFHVEGVTLEHHVDGDGSHTIWIRGEEF